MIAGDEREREGRGDWGGGVGLRCSKPLNAYFKVGEGDSSQFYKMRMV